MTTEIKYHTKEEALAAIIQDGDELKFCTQELQNDEEVVMAAIKQGAWAFHQAHYKLKSNKTFIMKALHEGVHPWYLIKYSNLTIQSDIEVMSLAVEKSIDGLVFRLAKEEASLNKELAAKTLIKWGSNYGSDNSGLWEDLEPTLQEFFPKDSWYEKAQLYFYQLEQEKQAEMVAGGSAEEDEVVW